ncbi:hypothetical protein HCC61_05365 [Streptomyces sp. HNM0575]|uniref:hypothetical protein n=1 Tax=Streptomyces sp. HNM0575 TaxID=2716338 RepID=UPI00145FBFC9|nr:hypothetical protein [Streptomyces sp. HNM0575]NLU72118.1 hypothetical protein [Streptomyces sp. HNM0575]
MLRPGARIAGAVLLAALAVLDLAWIARDFGQATDVTDAWWMWSGLIFRAQDGIWASSFVEPTLLVLYTVCAATAAVSSAAGGVLVSTGVLTILLRVPTLWNLNASWVKGGVSDALRNQVFTSVIAMLVVGVALIVLAAAGRRSVPRADGDDGGDGALGGTGATGATGGTRDDPPARPTRAGGLTACVLLTVVAAVLLSWEIHSVTEQGWELYSHHFTGDRALATLLAVPDSWYGCALALVCLPAAVAARARAPYSRPLGMTVCGPLLGLGLFRLSFGIRSGLLGGFGEIAARDQLWLCTALFDVLAALGVLLALAGRDGDAAAGPATDGEARATAPRRPGPAAGPAADGEARATAPRRPGPATATDGPASGTDDLAAGTDGRGTATT